MQSLESIMRENFEAVERALRKELDSVTKLLAILCEHVEKSPQALVLITIADGKIASWWGNHKKIEAERMVEEKASEDRRIASQKEELDRKSTRDKVLEKLTSEEKEILGIS